MKIRRLYSPKTLAFLLTTGQFLLILFIFATGSFPDEWFYRAILLFSFLLAVWAVYVKRLQVNVLPIPSKGMSLVTTGPYKYIRHPMYVAVLLSTLTFIKSSDGKINSALLLAWLALLIVLIIKINLEESILIKHYSNYRKYSQNTWRLFPFVY